MLNIKDAEARRSALIALVDSARELGVTPDQDPIEELYHPTTGLPR